MPDRGEPSGAGLFGAFAGLVAGEYGGGEACFGPRGAGGVRECGVAVGAELAGWGVAPPGAFTARAAAMRHRQQRARPRMVARAVALVVVVRWFGGYSTVAHGIVSHRVAAHEVAPLKVSEHVGGFSGVARSVRGERVVTGVAPAGRSDRGTGTAPPGRARRGHGRRQGTRRSRCCRSGTPRRTGFRRQG